jgi:hypothetical protein
MLRRRKTLNKAKSLVGTAFLAFVVMGCPSTHNPTTSASKQNSAPASLAGTEWILRDLAGTPALENVKATLAFLERQGCGECIVQPLHRLDGNFRRYH